MKRPSCAWGDPPSPSTNSTPMFTIIVEPRDEEHPCRPRRGALEQRAPRLPRRAPVRPELPIPPREGRGNPEDEHSEMQKHELLEQTHAEEADQVHEQARAESEACDRERDAASD